MFLGHAQMSDISTPVCFYIPVNLFKDIGMTFQYMMVKTFFEQQENLFLHPLGGVGNPPLKIFKN